VYDTVSYTSGHVRPILLAGHGEQEFAVTGAGPGRQVAAAIESLALFAGTASVSYSGPWRSAYPEDG
jgi:hypothetical protein